MKTLLKGDTQFEHFLDEPFLTVRVYKGEREHANVWNKQLSLVEKNPVMEI